MMNHVTYHHYGATILEAPIAELHAGIGALLNVPLDLGRMIGHPTTVTEEMSGYAAGTHTLICRSTTSVPEIAEYITTWTLACIADAPHMTLVEWMREYRPAAPSEHDQIQPFVSTLLDHDRVIASLFATEYGGSEVVYIDYTLGGHVSLAALRS
jgi:hypothetical protein